MSVNYHFLKFLNCFTNLTWYALFDIKQANTFEGNDNKKNLEYHEKIIK